MQAATFRFFFHSFFCVISFGLFGKAWNSLPAQSVSTIFFFMQENAFCMVGFDDKTKVYVLYLIFLCVS